MHCKNAVLRQVSDGQVRSIGGNGCVLVNRCFRILKSERLQAQVLKPIDEYIEIYVFYMYILYILNYLVINCCIQETSLTSNPWGPFYRSWKCCCSSFGGLAGTFHRAPTNRNVNPCRKNHVDANGWLMMTDSLTWVVCSIRADELAGGVPVFLALPASMFK